MIHDKNKIFIKDCEIGDLICHVDNILQYVIAKDDYKITCKVYGLILTPSYIQFHDIRFNSQKLNWWDKEYVKLIKSK